MRAVVMIDDSTGPRLAETPEPAPGPGEVKVRVRASSLNGFDALLAAGTLKNMYEHRFPLALGKDFAGTVVDVGAGVTDLTVGDEVFGVVSRPLPTDGGGFGEYLITDAHAGIARLPAGLDHRTAGALGLAGSAAVAAMDALALASGETVVVSGASGGVGAFVVQLAARAGASVIATATPGAATDHVRDLGARHVVDYHDDLPARVRELAPDGVTAAVHLAGDWFELAGLLTDGGRVVSLLHAGSDLAAGRAITATAVMATPSRPVLDRLATEATTGRLRVPISRTLRLDDVPAALGAFGTGSLGKVAVAVS
ncbi:NADP-dependent oxidoreductase [Plantactinospora sp. GCM10030261]|uniref:NADP-dependent oxidoreductase n=1 Tax=Plantactinospora sp. GCM10030261 TaxID=3273420 RepID=UPI00360813CE